jgi:hypothetical protein
MSNCKLSKVIIAALFVSGSFFTLISSDMSADDASFFAEHKQLSSASLDEILVALNKVLKCEQDWTVQDVDDYVGYLTNCSLPIQGDVVSFNITCIEERGVPLSASDFFYLLEMAVGPDSRWSLGVVEHTKLSNASLDAILFALHKVMKCEEDWTVQEVDDYVADLSNCSLPIQGDVVTFNIPCIKQRGLPLTAADFLYVLKMALGPDSRRSQGDV